MKWSNELGGPEGRGDGDNGTAIVHLEANVTVSGLGHTSEGSTDPTTEGILFNRTSERAITLGSSSTNSRIRRPSRQMSRLCGGSSSVADEVTSFRRSLRGDGSSRTCLGRGPSGPSLVRTRASPALARPSRAWA